MQRKHISTILLAAAVMMPAATMAAGDTPANAPRPAPSADRHPVDRTADTSAMTFKALDTNKDGHISKEEAKASNELNKQFADLDKDRDGKLSAREMAAWKGDAKASRAEPQTAGRSSMPHAPRSAPGTTGSTEGSGTDRPGGAVSR
jgi:hypothetical protein